MIEIYRRYNPGRVPSAPNNNASAPPPVQRQQILRETAPSKSGSMPVDKDHLKKNISSTGQSRQNSKSAQGQPRPDAKNTAKSQHTPPPKQPQQGFSFNNTIRGFLPPHLYNRETKKLFGFFTAEDLLLIALILIFSESEENDDPFTILALIYILLSDYIDLPDFLI